MLSGSLSQQIPHKVWARPPLLVFTHLSPTLSPRSPLSVRFLSHYFAPILLTATSTAELCVPGHTLCLCTPTLPLRAGLGGGGKKSPKRSISMSAQPRPHLGGTLAGAQAFGAPASLSDRWGARAETSSLCVCICERWVRTPWPLWRLRAGGLGRGETPQEPSAA